jgi:hypothetical protein
MSDIWAFRYTVTQLMLPRIPQFQQNRHSGLVSINNNQCLRERVLCEFFIQSYETIDSIVTRTP